MAAKAACEALGRIEVTMEKPTQPRTNKLSFIGCNLDRTPLNADFRVCLA